jgi:hypothetical protein
MELVPDRHASTMAAAAAAAAVAAAARGIVVAIGTVGKK